MHVARAPIVKIWIAIAVNLETARRIHFHLPEGLLKAPDMVYESIEGEEG